MGQRKKVAFVIPTGVGASIGGFAGDASFWAREFAKHFDLIVNPNVVNAACFSGITENMFYTEGWALSEFFAGRLNLLPSKNNKIGVIFDKSMPEDVLNIHINTLNAVKTVYGVDIIGYEITDEGCGVEFFITENGVSSGELKNPSTLFEAGKKLVNRGAEAIAVVCLFPEPPEDNYSQGEGVDIVGGVEAVISHYLSRELFIPAAHSPAFADYQIKGEIVSEKASAEYITPTFLPCVLLGLQNAPRFTSCGGIHISDIAALVMPCNSLGTSIIADAIKAGTKVFAIRENKTILNVDKYALNLQNYIIETETYSECLDLIKNL